jgi:hypothetical protein
MHTKLGINGTKFGCTKVTHKNVHEKLDGIDLEGYASHLSNQTHSTRPKYAGDILGQSSVFSALSDVVVVSKVSKFVRLATLVTYGAQWQ